MNKIRTEPVLGRAMWLVGDARRLTRRGSSNARRVLRSAKHVPPSQYHLQTHTILRAGNMATKDNIPLKINM